MKSTKLLAAVLSLTVAAGASVPIGSYVPKHSLTASAESEGSTVNTDELVASYKSTPIIPFEERIALMKAIKGPDIVIPQRSLDHTDKVHKLNFDIFVVGDDWVGKYDYLKELGVQVVYFPYGEGISSSNLKKKIYKNNKKLQNKVDNHLPVDIDVKK